MKQTRIRLFGSVLMIIVIPMALFILGIWKNSDSHLTTQVLMSGIAVLVIVEERKAKTVKRKKYSHKMEIKQ